MGSFPSGGSKPLLRGYEATLHDLLSGSGYLGTRLLINFQPLWIWGVAGSRADQPDCTEVGETKSWNGAGLF